MDSGEGYSNPYRPPTGDAAPTALESGALVDASRGARLAASLIDLLVETALILPAQISAGTLRGFPKIRQQTLTETALWNLVSVAAFLAVNGYFLAKSGQTLGKNLMKIQVVTVRDRLPVHIARYVGVRYLPFQAISLVPSLARHVLPALPKLAANLLTVMLGAVTLGDVLLIFRADRRCLHDHIAGTRVCRVDARPSDSP